MRQRLVYAEPVIRRLLLLATATLFVGCATPVPTEAEFDFGEGRVTALRTQDGLCRLTLTGRITQPFEQAFQAALQSLEATGCQRRLVSLNSGGGLIAPALRVGRIIRDKRMDTEIAAGSKTRCASACGFLFIAGIERRAKSRLGDEGPSRELGFHQASRRVDGEKVCATEETIRPALAQQLRQYANAMLPAEGADAMMQLMMATDCRRMLFLDAAALLRLGITTH